MNQQVYIRQPYEISALECYEELRDVITNNTLVGMKLTKQEYLSRLEVSIEVYSQVKGIDPNWSDLKRKHAYLVKPFEPSFDWWFAIYLSLVDCYEIPLILDENYKRWTRTDMKFTNLLEHFVLNIQKHNLFHDFKENRKAIIDWIREHRQQKQQAHNGTMNYNCINIQSTVINQFNQYVHNYFTSHIVDGTSTQTEPDTETSTIGTSTLFNNPFQDHLFISLLPFCEEDSIPLLQEILIGHSATDKVIFKSNFKKISIRRALKYLITKGDCTMNQTTCANWLNKYFAVRINNQLSNFEIDGTIDVFKQLIKQTPKSQIKFEDWYQS